MVLSTAALIAAGAAAAIGAGGSAINRKRAREEEARNYQNAKDYLNSLYYRDPLSTVGNRSLLKAAKENYADGLDAINNRMVAGGATMENQLAARQAQNENLDKVYGQLLMGEDARRDRISAQQLQLDQQHSGNVQNGFYQAAQDWNQWGQQTAGAFMSLGSSGLLGGEAAGAVGKYAADMDKYRDAISALGMTEPIVGSAPNVNAPSLVTTPDLGGLKGVPGWVKK